MESVPCNLCGSAAARERWRIRADGSSLRCYRYARRAARLAGADPELTGTFTVVECAGCGLVYVNPRLDAAQLGRVYGTPGLLGGQWRSFRYLFRASEPDDLPTAGAAATDQRWKLDLLRKWDVAPGGAVLDVGCGRGEFVRAAGDAGFDAFGFDLSPERVAHARDALGLGDRVAGGDAAAVARAFPGRSFDAITLWDVVEHLRDPRAALAQLAPLCHARTRVFVHTMSLDSWTYRLFRRRWYYVFPPIHLYYFSDRTVADLLGRAGFVFLAKENDATPAPTPWRLLRALALGLGNHLMFAVYGPRRSAWRWLRPLLRPCRGAISAERLQARLENLYPGLYTGRHRDDFVYVARPKVAPALSPAAARDRSSRQRRQDVGHVEEAHRRRRHAVERRDRPLRHGLARRRPAGGERHQPHAAGEHALQRRQAHRQRRAVGGKAVVERTRDIDQRAVDAHRGEVEGQVRRRQHRVQPQQRVGDGEVGVGHQVEGDVLRDLAPGLGPHEGNEARASGQGLAPSRSSRAASHLGRLPRSRRECGGSLTLGEPLQDIG